MGMFIMNKGWDYVDVLFPYRGHHSDCIPTAPRCSF